MDSERPADAGGTPHDLMRYQKLLEAVAVQAWVSNADGSSIEILLGKPLAGGPSVNLNQRLELMHPDDLAMFHTAADKAISERSVLDIIARFRNDDGQWQHYRVQAQPILDPEGEIAEWIGVSTDVSQIATVQRELHEQHAVLTQSQERLKVALAAAQMGVWEFHVPTREFFWSPETQAMVGWPREMMAEAELVNLIHPEDLADFRNHLARALVPSGNFHLEYRLRRPDGEYRWFICRAVIRCDKQGEPERMVGTFQDATDRRTEATWLQAQNAMLRRIATGVPIQELYSGIIELIELGLPGSQTLLNLLDQDQRLRLAQTNLQPPEVWGSMVNGVEIGPLAGACGAAAFFQRLVVVEDIASDPRTQSIVDLAEAAGLKSCLSFPLIAPPHSSPNLANSCSRPEPSVLGILTVFRDRQGSPSPSELRKIEQAGQLAAIAIQRHHDEEAITESANRFRDLANAMPQLVWTAEASGLCNYSNQRLQETLGGGLGQGNWLEAIHPDDRDITIQRYSAAMASSQPYEVEHRLRLATGEYRWYLSRATASLDGAGRIKSWYGAATDIHDLKHAEQVLRAERERWTALTEASPGVVFTYRETPNGEACFPYAAPTLSGLLGLAPASVQRDATPLFARLEPEDGERLYQELHRAAELGTAALAIVRAQHPERGRVWIECHAAYRTTAEGDRLWHGVFTDITQRKLLEERLLQSEKMEALGRLAGGIAHDFNNLLTVILGTCDLWGIQTSGTGPVSEHVLSIRQAAQRAAGLTKQLLAFSRQQPIKPRTINPNQVVREAMTILERLLGDSYTLNLELSPDVPWVHVDPLQLEQILINLAINARDAMPHGGCITFRTHPALEATGCSGTGQYAAIAVIDQGTGIPCEDQSRIFEPFFTTKEVGRGTGLGLAVVHGIVTQAGGVVHLDSQVNRGTELRILLPAVPPPSTEPAAQTPGGLKITGAGESVLVVDDEPVIGQIVKQTLEPLGYQVWVAESARQARELIDQQNLTFDALITDLSMPHQRGDQLAAEFQQRFPHLKIVLMSGHEMNPAHPSRAFRNQLQFLAKPFSAAELARSLQRALLSEERSTV